jgi:DNA (cytosine-5)-methyltransferase 1
VVAGAQTEWFVMENVALARHSRAFEVARQLSKRSGYGLTEMVLDASLCGVPQRCRRFFCIGRLGEADGFLNEALKAKMASRPLTVRAYLGDDLEVTHYYRHPRSYARRAVYSVDEPAPTMRGTNRPVAPGYRRHPLDAVDPAATRALTVRERSQIQTFPNEWRWTGRKADIDQMIGNAVPVALAQFVADAVRTFSLKSLLGDGQRRVDDPFGARA